MIEIAFPYEDRDNCSVKSDLFPHVKQKKNCFAVLTRTSSVADYFYNSQGATKSKYRKELEMVISKSIHTKYSVVNSLRKRQA